jgi:hypothetical protein
VISASNRPYVPPQIDLLSAPVGLLHHTKVRRQREKERDRERDRERKREREWERERERKKIDIPCVDLLSMTIVGSL